MVNFDPFYHNINPPSLLIVNKCDALFNRMAWPSYNKPEKKIYINVLISVMIFNVTVVFSPTVCLAGFQLTSWFQNLSQETLIFQWYRRQSQSIFFRGQLQLLLRTPWQEFSRQHLAALGRWKRRNISKICRELHSRPSTTVNRNCTAEIVPDNKLCNKYSNNTQFRKNWNMLNKIPQGSGFCSITN